MKNVCYVEASTGKILGNATVSDDMYNNFPPSITKLRIDGTYPSESFYYDLGTAAMVAKGEMATSLDKTTITADGVDYATISGIPVGTLASIPGTLAQTVNDGALEVSSDFAKSLVVRLQHLEWKDKLYTVEAV